MEKSLSELLVSHFSLLAWLDIDSLRGRKQLDYLRFYVPIDKQLLYGTPFMEWVRDNPNYKPTWYKNVYSMTDYKYSLWDYVLPNVAPVSVLRWGKVKVKKDWEIQELMEICIYWKALALYYAGHLSWLKEFVIKYQWECSRVDLCWDFPNELPWNKIPWDIYTDLRNTWLFPNNDNTGFDTIYYWNKRSPLFIRIYNKTADLRKDKNIHSRIYPSWYMKECRRVEFELKGRYAQVATPLDWLDSYSRDFKIQPLEQTKRNNYKTALYSLINCVEIINYDDWEKIQILNNVKELINMKLKNLYHN